MIQLPIGLLLAISGLASAGGNAISAGTTSAANRQQAQGYARQRAEYAPLLARLRNPNFGSLDRRAITEMSRASDQITANRASEGMLDAGRGGQDALVGQAVSDILASLAQAKQQADAQNQQLIAEILSGEAFAAPDPESFKPGQDALLGFLGGAAAGVGQGLSTLMGTELGLESLGGAGGFGKSAFPTATSGPKGSNMTFSFPRTSAALGRGGGGSPRSFTPY